MFGPRFRKYGGYWICSEACLAKAVRVAYHAACALGGAVDRPCGRANKNSAAVLSELAAPDSQQLERPEGESK